MYRTIGIISAVLAGLIYAFPMQLLSSSYPANATMAAVRWSVLP